jgi:molecular chaperone DnaK (HSP70)
VNEPFIGIDFGTCNSSAAWFDPSTGRAESLLNAEGDNKTPSVVYFGPNNEIVVGKHAEERLEDPEARKWVLTAVKRNLTKKIAQRRDGR